MALKPYKISDNVQRIAQQTGFDIAHPDKRYRVEKTTIHNIHLRQQTRSDPRRDALLKAREGYERKKVRGR